MSKVNRLFFPTYGVEALANSHRQSLSSSDTVPVSRSQLHKSQNPPYPSQQITTQVGTGRESWSTLPASPQNNRIPNVDPNPKVCNDLLSALTRQRDEINAQIAALQSGKLTVPSYQSDIAAPHHAQPCAPLRLDLTRESGISKSNLETSRRIDFDEGRSEGKAMYVSDYLPSSQRASYVGSWDDHPSEINDRVVADYSLDFSNNDFNSNSRDISDNNPLCSCGIPAIKLVSKTSANMNREFYKCAAPIEANRCPFFQWVDGDTVSAVSHQYDPTSHKDYMIANKRIFGHNRFREGQKQCIEAALQGSHGLFLSVDDKHDRKRCVLFNAYRWWKISCVSTPCLLLRRCIHRV